MAADKLENLLNNKGNRELGDLVKRAQKMAELSTALSAALPADLADSIVAANIRENGELVVICKTPARAARLRFEASTLIRAASSPGVEISRCIVRVSQAKS
ncbi:MAG TPA: DciA family protein [Woeseiaceae bacterium]|nr:DciA family protein [Woeseiaceae bacterium]